MVGPCSSPTRCGKVSAAGILEAGDQDQLLVVICRSLVSCWLVARHKTASGGGEMHKLSANISQSPRDQSERV